MDSKITRKNSSVSRSTDRNAQPLRAELFNADQMDQYAIELAQLHVIDTHAATNDLLKRLSDNARVIDETRKFLIEETEDNARTTPAEEWLLDNYYLINEQINLSKLHLPKKYSYGLPRLIKGPSANLPRVYDIALEIVAHSDAHIDPVVLSRFISSYQTVSPLTLGELWALPIMLRLALIENLRRISARLQTSRKHQNLADNWANRMIQTAEKNPSDLILVIADMARSEPPIDGAFVAEITRRLQGHGPSLNLPLSWVEQRLAQSGLNSENHVVQEVQLQAANQVSISNSIGSLRILKTINWQEFVENLSLVEAALRRDPAGYYDRMDFATRDTYRHKIEDLSKKSRYSEIEIAQLAVEEAKKFPLGQRYENHVGYYLIGKGSDAFEKSLSLKLSFAESIKKIAARHPLSIYLGAIFFITLVAAWVFIRDILSFDLHFAFKFLLTAFALIASSQFAVSVVNWLGTKLVTPKPLPRMDFSTGIPADAATFVVVPTMLSPAVDIENLCDELEVRYLANAEKNIFFALLTDFTDAPRVNMDGDENLVTSTAEKIAYLNIKYGQGKDIFFLFHRPRVWNARENKWMGYERKRGKLAALNHYLLNGDGSTFSHIVGEIPQDVKIKYIITLDTDTQLPWDSARQCIGTMMHPLNRPIFDEAKKRVVEGYGILQPRVSLAMPEEGASFYANLWGGEAGIDVYTRMVSDLYQDVFGEGSFVGKGIYEIEAFEKSAGGIFPENRILSHDLLEGCYARAGMLSDVQLFEAYPNRYASDMSRRHRWVRGDWQIANWVLPYVPVAGGKYIRNKLSGLSRWKIFDNLRRSFVAISFTMLFAFGWLLSAKPGVWTVWLIALSLLPSVIFLAYSLVRKSAEISFGQHLQLLKSDAKTQFYQFMFMLASFPYEAFYHADAILRTIWRLVVSGRNLLQWVPSSLPASDRKDDLLSAFRSMWGTTGIVAAIIVLFIYYQKLPSAAAPLLLLWAFFPAYAWFISRLQPGGIKDLDEKQIRFLRRTARKTWKFFERFVGADDNWLPPDNVQEKPVSVIAHRTSPTNMGLSLLSNLSAWDFGYISTARFIERTKNALTTMERLEKFEGHFLNWYDTQTLQPLFPKYVSTVDSGNLAGHLLTLKQGVLDIIRQPVFDARIYKGLWDTFLLYKEENDKNIPEELSRVGDLLIEGANADEINLPRIKSDMGEIYAIASRNLGGGVSEWGAELYGQICLFHDELNKIPHEFLGTDALPTLENIAVYDIQAQACISELQDIAYRCEILSQMSYGFLYNNTNNLLAIGYNVSDQRRDAGYYDLLASEARLTDFVAIAQRQIPQDNWFALSRKLAKTSDKPTLVSWSGSMFEYLMPMLVMPSPENTLLDQACRAAVHRQIEYGNSNKIPWGISESGYYMFDASLNYQYRAFGVPGLGMKRGLGDDLVIAPYATIMALMVAPHAAYKNMKRLTREGFEGKYGYYEAVDYTSSRLPRGKSSIIIESFMVHHQGMAFLSLAYALLDKPMQKRFEAEPAFRAAMPLLHEKAPKTAILEIEENDKASAPGTMNDADPVSRYVSTPHTPIPQVQLLSNGRYHVMATNAGGSSSRWNNLAVTRYRVDGTRDNWGSFCYIRDVSRDKYWSASYQPVLGNPDFYESILSEGRVEYRRRDGDIETHTDIIVSPEDDVEIRRIRVKNLSRQKKTIEVTSYAEVVMAPQAADMAHPAFSNLFVQTEILSDKNALLCTRRARSENETPPWMCHFMSVRDAEIGAVSFETDRMKFIGRGNTTQNPAVMRATGPLSGTQGSVLDPVVAIRRFITIEPQQSAIIDIVTGAAETRDTCISMIDKYNDAVLSNRVFELAWSHNQVILRQLNTNEKDSQLFNRLASGILYANNPLRADASVVMRNRRGQSGLWGYSISGDYPILLLQVRSGDSLDLVRHLIQAHAYWRLKGLSVDLVIWNEDQGGYRQVLQDQIIGMITAGPESSQVDRPGGIFVRSAEHISPEDRVLFETVAKVILRDTDGSLEEQVSRLETKLSVLPRLQITSGTKSAWPTRNEDIQLPETILSNGIGGFTPDGKEYVIKSSRRDRTPAPWSNVIANPYFGTVISESGQSYTWSDNAHEYRLTPWMNDPVSDGSGEAFYIRDENNGFFWSPSPGAAPDGGDYITRHGFGYTTFEHVYDGIRTELTVYVAIDAPIKFSVIKIKNESGRRRKLSVTGYVEWVLGDIRSKTGMHIVTQVDKATGAILARNGYNPDFSERIAFFDVNDNARSFTCDRREFIGRNGNLTHPQALERARLSGTVGASMDSCAALQSVFEIADGEAKEIVFKLGIAGNRVDEASAFIRRYYGRGPARIAFEGVDQFWKNTLGTVQVQTPDPALNVLANGWLMYQTIACRLWARSGYYQSGGAFGFRDQLQDAMAVIHTKPEFLRAQILLCAEHQFIEGDVQHWWHPPQDRGVRTKCSDDYLWLPLAVCRYVTATGDTGILDEVRHFLEGRQLGPDEDSYYDLPLRSGEHADIYEHCVRALRHGMRLGEHGLPLIGSCDWNDGMDKVGEHGKGESVWLAFFIYDIMKQFAALAEMRKDAAMLAFCHESAETLKRNIDENAWDGAWYRRAYFDDGTPLGSASNEECQIDSLSQSWSILSGAADQTRAKNAMAEVDKRLVRRDAGLIQLLDPPFDKKGKNPGYIRGYVPGVRENGGQYTHAAIWTAMAFAKMGDGDKSYELFDLINPLNHARNIEDAKLYKVEPYVVAADVYGVAPHTGRGGWTWYTGSSGWMYRLLIESILGLGLAGDKIVVDPCLPAKWDRFAVDYKHMNTMYRIEIVRTGRKQVILNNEARDGNTIHLLKDGGTHSVVVEI